MRYEDVDVRDIKILENIRQRPIQEDLADLMSSIRSSGLMQPIGVKEKKSNGKNYILVWGYRRLQACKKLGWKTIPARIFLEDEDELDEEEFLILNASENLHRKDVSLMELGRICEYLQKTMSIGEIATNLNISPNKVNNALVELQRIPKEYRTRVEISTGKGRKKGHLPLSVASVLARIKGLNKQEKMNVFEWARKEEKKLEEVMAFKNLVDGGIPIERAKKEINRYRVVHHKFLIDEEYLDRVLKEGNADSRNLMRQCINEKYPDLIF